MMCCNVRIEPIVEDDVYISTMDFVHKNSIDLTLDEMLEMKNSIDLSFSYIPINHCEKWYNCTIECDNFSIIIQHGFLL